MPAISYLRYFLDNCLKAPLVWSLRAGSYEKYLASANLSFETHCCRQFLELTISSDCSNILEIDLFDSFPNEEQLIPSIYLYSEELL